MGLYPLIFLFLLPCLSFQLKQHKEEHFDEELIVTRLSTGHLSTHFRFAVSNVAKELSSDSYFFPPIMTELLEKYSLSELSLSLGRGNWQTSKWGIPPQPSSSQGARIVAWLDNGIKETEVNSRWSSLVNTLNGVFCTSLSGLDPSFTVSSSSSFKENGPPLLKGERALRFGSMTEETVCTENLTPWRKLLPCRSSGLVSLLNPLRIFHSAFHSISFHVFLHCSDGSSSCTSPTWRMSLDATIVFDLPMSDRRVDWSMEELFDRSIAGECTVARSSWLITADHLFTPSFDRHVNATKKVNETEFHMIDLKGHGNGPLNVVAKYQEKKLDFTAGTQQSVVSIGCSLLGGEASRTGTLLYSIDNRGKEERIVQFSAIVPWYAQLHYASLKMQCWKEETNDMYAPLNESHHFIPSLALQRPASIEWNMELQGHSHCELSVRFDRVFMRSGDYPSDANHGKYIPPASITILPHSHTTDIQYIVPGNMRRTARESLLLFPIPSPLTIHSNSLLLALPVPDFSMPYNVEAFVCIVVSLCFTPFFNYSTSTILPCGDNYPLMSRSKRISRVLLYILTIGAMYAEFKEMTPALIMRSGRKVVATVVSAINETINQGSFRVPLGLTAVNEETIHDDL